MRFGFGLFLGVLIVLVGVSIILETVFHVDVPLARTAFALFLIYIGIRMLVGGWGPLRHGRHEGSAIFTERSFRASDDAPGRRDRYEVVFGRGVVDLTGIPVGAGGREIQVDTVFGTSLVKVDPAMAVDVQGSAAFGKVEMPDRNEVAFGTLRYRSPGQGAPRLRVRVNAVFGSCEVIEEAGGGAAAPSGPTSP